MEKRRSLTRRDFLRISALAAGGAALAACAPSAGTTGTQTKTEEKPVAAPATGTTEVVLWDGGFVDIAGRLAKNPTEPSTLWYKWLLENFEAQNPGVKIKGEDHGWDEPLRTGLLTAIAGGTAPEATIGEAFVHEFAALGAFNAVVDTKADDFVIGSVLGALIEGKLYGVPAFTSSFALEINKDVLEKSGVDPTTTPKSWNDLIEISTKIYEAGDKGKNWFGFTVYGPTPVRTYGSALRAMPWINRTGALMGPDDGSKATFNDPKAVTAYEMLRSLFKTTDPGTSMSEDEQKVGGALWDNKAAFQVSAVWDGMFARDRKANTVFVQIPVCSETTCKAANVVLGNLTWSPLAKAKNPELGVKWCDFVGTEEAQKQIGAIRGGVLPARKSALQDPNLTKQKPYEGYAERTAVQQQVLLTEETHPTPPFSKNASKIWNMWSDVFGKVLLTDTPVPALLDEMQQQAEKFLAG
jgi:ABC-type glycerol-3-phosphate transport system substrate-binding protein